MKRANVHGIILRLGRRWKRPAVEWALKSLLHRGECGQVFDSPEIEVHCVGVSPRTTQRDQLFIWSWNLDEPGHERIIQIAVSPNPLESIVPKLGTGLVLIWRKGEEILEVHRGLDCDIPILWAKSGRNLFIAPERKAFSDVSSRKRINYLGRGGSLIFSCSESSARTSKVSPLVETLPLTELSFENCQRVVEELLDDAMLRLKREYPGKFALALSGGLDSSISALLAVKAGIDCEAFTVWFDSGSSDPPSDLIGARMTSKNLGIPHHELRVGVEELEELAREAVHLSEYSAWRAVETASYVIRLVKAVKERGYGHLLSGEGADGLFAGFVTRKRIGSLHRHLLADQRSNQNHAFNRIPPTLGINILSPFKDSDLRAFAMTLPEEFLYEEKADELQGKRILRETFSDRLFSKLAMMRKDSPVKTAGGEVLFEKLWGCREERTKLYAAWLEELLPIPKFRRGS